jgi:signal transduction histidine kinase
MFINPAFAALCDEPADAPLVGTNVVTASGRRIESSLLDAALKSDVHQQIHWPSARRTSRDFVCTVRCVREDDVPLCLVVTLHDIDALVADRSRERVDLDSLCEASGLIAACSWQLRLDEPSAKICWSPQAGAVLGIGTASPPTDLAAFLRLIPPEDRVHVNHAIAGAIEQSGGYEVQYRLRSMDGSLHTMIGLGKVVEAADDSRRLIALELDTARSNIAGGGSVFQERLLSAVLAGTDQPICVLDRQLRYSHFNAAYAALISATQGIAVTNGMPSLDSIQDVARRRRLGATLSRTLKGERLIETMEFEYPESHARQWIDFSFSPLLSADGRVDGIVACGQDVSAARNAERRRRRFNEELQRQVKLQTEKLDNAAWGLNAVLAPAVDAFDTPLQRLGTAIEILQQPMNEIVSRPAEPVLRDAARATDEIADLVRGLSDLPLVATCELKMEQIDMNRLFQECLQAELERTAGRQVELDIAALPPLRTDRKLIQLVVRHLLGAVIKATPARVGVLAAATGDELVWTITNGTGFTQPPARSSEDGLETFGENPADRLSLAIVRGAVRCLGGRVWAEGDADRSVALHFVIAGE